MVFKQFYIIFNDILISKPQFLLLDNIFLNISVLIYLQNNNV